MPNRLIVITLVALFAGATIAAQIADDPFAYIPDTISVPWQEALRKMSDPGKAPPLPNANDIAAWKKFHDEQNAKVKPAVDAALARYRPQLNERTIGGVPVLEITPQNWKDDGRLAIYTHGGGFTKFTARTTLNNSAYFAHETGLRVLAIDYTNAPNAKWQQITDEIVVVLKALSTEGQDMSKTVIYGDSAGGALAAAAILKLRDSGGAMPGAIILWAPWSDLAETGNTYHTLRGDDPKLVYQGNLKNCADAYADPKDHEIPYVSPVYGDYSTDRGGFPPTLIQVGTKDILLSCAVRHYQAIDWAGGDAILDVYEGMPHVFQPSLPDSRESKQAMRKVNQFIDANLER